MRDNNTTDTGTPERRGTIDQCPECGGSIRVDTADAYCKDCGRTVSVAKFDSPNHTGSLVRETTQDQNLGTVVPLRDTDARKNVLNTTQQIRARRNRRWNQRAKFSSSQERSRKKGLIEIKRMASALGVRDIVKRHACGIFSTAVDEGLLPGRSVEAVASAALKCATRVHSFPLTSEQLVSVSRSNRSSIASARRYIVQELSLSIPPADPEQFVERYRSELHLPPRTTKMAYDALAVVRKHNIHVGKKPQAVAATVLYVIAKIENVNITQQQAADISDTTTKTISDQFIELEETGAVREIVEEL